MLECTQKSYEGLHFRLTIPELREFANRIDFSSKFMYRNMGNEVDTVLEKAVFTDKVNVVYKSNKDYSLLPYGKTKRIQISILTEGKKIFYRDATIEFTFLCSDYKRVVISYQIDGDKKLKLNQIMVYKMSSKEYKKTIEIIKVILKNEVSAKPTIDVADVTRNLSEEGKASYLTASLKDYSDALHKEINFLKNGKGRKHKVVSGIKINKDNKGICTYSFELETELHLPDDAPIVIETSNGLHATGSVLTCEDFQIMLLVNGDLGEKILTAYLTVEPWKLLEALDKKITSLNPKVHRLAVELLEQGPQFSTKKDISVIEKGQEEVLRKLLQNDIVAVWGPPGTGKTYTMSQIAKEYVVSGKSVLIVSHSNVSVDGVIKKIIQIVDEDKSIDMKNGKILRLGYVRDEELVRHPYATSFNYTLSRSYSLASQLNQFISKREELKAKKKEKTKEYDEIEKKIKYIRNEVRKEEKRYVQRAQLIATTISRATIDPMFDTRQYDLVMFDEVSMAYVPQVIAAAALAKEKFICVGDFRQLAPISQCPNANLLKTDIFSFLRIIDSKGQMFWHPWLVMLNEQRRMHPDISGFSNKYIYKKLLKNHESVLQSRNYIVNTKPLIGNALNLINLAGTYCAADKNTDGSRFNILSAIISFSTAASIHSLDIDSVGIITPYVAQSRLIRAMIKDYGNQNNTTISCATVHQFQGSESDVIIFDAVESYPKSSVGYLLGKDPDNITRLINVAVTRSKGKLITVANVSFWDNLYRGSNHVFYKLLNYIRQGYTEISQKNKLLKTYIENINPQRMFQIYTKEEDAICEFEKDVANASGRVVVSLPSGNLKETQDRIIQAIDAASERGIDIFMKSNEYSELPCDWKKYCYGTDNAVFPVIIIDDEIAWYGLPTANWKFKVDKTSSLMTVVHIMVRIKGKNTIEMIKALTELEEIQVGDKKKSLLNVSKNMLVKNNTHNFSMEGSTFGLAAFVEEKEFCPDCKKPMVLTKNRRGTAYLKCSNKNCKNTRYLKPQFIDWYIEKYDIRCPKDRGTLKGILGQYGPCIKCSRDHFLKPEEI